LHIAADKKDYITLIVASYWLGIFQGFECEFEKAQKSFQVALDINTAAKSLWGIATQKAQMAYYCYFFPGKINALMELSSDALKIAQESGDPISRGVSHTVHGIACYTKGYLEKAENHTLQGKDLLVRIGMHGWALAAILWVSQTYFEMKEYRKSKVCFEQGLRIYETTGIVPSWARLLHLGIARSGLMLGERDVNLESLRAIVGKNRVKAAEGWGCRYLGEILLNLGDSHNAETDQWIRKSIEADSRNGMMFSLGSDYALYGEYFKRQGDRTRAQEELGKAAEIMRQCGADGWVEKYQKELAALS